MRPFAAKEGISRKGACPQGPAMTDIQTDSWSHFPLLQALLQHLSLKLTWHLIISKPGGQSLARSRFLSSAFKSINVCLLDSMIKKYFKSALREWCEH